MDYKKFSKFSKNLYCEKCDYYANRMGDFNKHLKSKKHNDYKTETNDYTCECGNIYTNRQNLYRHKTTCKILNNSQHNEKMLKKTKKWLKMANFEKCPFFCVCGKSYKHQSSLCKHKKNCPIILENNENKTETEDLKEMVKELIKLAKEPKIIHNTTNNTQFNVMNYLNTECKDAMNLSDFISQFTFSLEDLEILGTQGYEKAMENTFVRELKDMDKTKRPIHCTDRKRKTFYIKDNDIWEKDKNNKKLIIGIKQLSRKHFNTINNWRMQNDDWLENDIKHDFFNNSVMEVCKCDKNKEMNKIVGHLSLLSIK